jgi:hypothetical protein
MGHILDVGDLLDMLEESITTKRPFVIVFKHGHEFEDRVKEIVKIDGEDHVVFHDHDTVPLHSISTMRRASPLEHTYKGKRTGSQSHPKTDADDADEAASGATPPASPKRD